MYVYMCIYIYIERDAYVYTYMYICTHTCVCLYVYIHIHVYTYIYICVHIPDSSLGSDSATTQTSKVQTIRESCKKTERFLKWGCPEPSITGTL